MLPRLLQELYDVCGASTAVWDARVVVQLLEYAHAVPRERGALAEHGSLWVRAQPDRL